MYNLKVVLNECKEELNALDINYGNIIDIKPNTRALNRWGQVKIVPSGFIININYLLLNESNGIEPLKTTILHELCHTVPNCFNHTKNWQQVVTKVNRYYGYNIKRISSNEEKLIDPQLRKLLISMKNKKRSASGRVYQVQCCRCDKIFTRRKKSVLITNPEWFSCKCGGKLKNI